MNAFSYFHNSLVMITHIYELLFCVRRHFVSPPRRGTSVHTEARVRFNEAHKLAARLRVTVESTVATRVQKLRAS